MDSPSRCTRCGRYTWWIVLPLCQRCADETQAQTDRDRLTAELAALRDAMPPDSVGLLREAGRTIEKEAGGHWATRRALAAKLCAWADRLEKEK